MPDLRRLARRLPLRVKLTLVYAVIVSIALGAVGGVLYLRFESQLNQSIDDDLRTRASALAALISEQGPGVISGAAGQQLLAPQESFAQVVAVPHNHVLSSTAPIAGLRLLDAMELRDSATHGQLIDRKDLKGIGRNARFATARVPGEPSRVVVVGRSLKDREGANESFAKALLIGGPLALLFVSAAGFGLATATLRPVESMRRRAATISTVEPGARLPVPEADDELGRLGRTLNEMLARLERSFAQQRALTANASHELRTPLAVLSTTLEVALRQERTAEETEAAMRDALAEAQRLSRLAEALLVLAHLDEENGGRSHGPISVDTLVADVVDRLREPAAMDGRRIDADLPRITIPGDPLQLAQAVENLVANALVHGRGTVTVEAETTSSAVTIHVRDEGAGLRPDFAVRAFDRFERDPSSSHRPGTGLGLAIVKAVAVAHGGTAGTGTGANVWIRLPIG